MNLPLHRNGKESVPSLARDCVHVWRLSTAANCCLDGVKEILSEEERTRAEHFHFEKDRRSFLMCRGSLRRLISAYTGQDAAGIRFQTGSHGKPFLMPAHASDLQFNVSHSGELALLAFSMDVEIGVDVEFKRAGIDFLELAESSFSAEERTAVLATSQADRANLFYEFWTCKEAFIKADGRGLSIPLDEFTVTSVAGKPQWREVVPSESSGLARGIRGHILDVGNNCAAAVATNTPVWDVLQMDLNLLLIQGGANEPSHFSPQNDPALAGRDKTRLHGSLSAAGPASLSEGGRP
jgi:4'-phosphopantetheinyl transferase